MFLLRGVGSLLLFSLLDSLVAFPYILDQLCPSAGAFYIFLFTCKKNGYLPCSSTYFSENSGSLRITSAY